MARKKKTFNSYPFAYHEEIELEISKLTNMGQGLARVEVPAPEAAGEDHSHDAESGGWVVLVPFALPGERVRVRVFRNHRNYSEADLMEVLRPSPDRIEAPCPLFGSCGGCQYQYLGYERQLEWKRLQVEELLRHMARIEFPVLPVKASPRVYGYRSKITPHFERPREDKPFSIGFLRQGTRSHVLDVPKCPLATDAINEQLAKVRAEVRDNARNYRNGATILLRDSADGVTSNPKAIIHEKVEGLTLHFPAGEFFQNNPFILESFSGYVREQASASGARYLIDAYCGSGLFCLTAARSFERAIGIEISEASIRWARENAQENTIGNSDFQVGDASAIFRQVDFPASETAVVIDPPRKGSTEAFLEQLVRFGPRTVVYVSCNPATQMRDLRTLLDGGYELKAVQPFDLFPQTRHLECVVTLRRPQDI